MSSAWSTPWRALATQTAVITIIGLGLAAPASAAPPDAPPGRGSDQAAAAKAEASEKQGPESQTHESRGQQKQASGTGLSDDRHTPMGEQPVSGADQNSGGANGQCADDPTADSGYFCGTIRDQASGNGRGDGQATGKPWQAHRGKADNKNPPGQSANDHNQGYECDGNQGIARGNPAHTSCVPGAVTTRTCPDGSPLPPSGNVADCDRRQVGGVDTENPPTGNPPEVKGVERVVPPAGVELVRPPAEAPAVLPGAAALPATGASSVTHALSALALVLLGLGAGLLVYRRVATG